MDKGQLQTKFHEDQSGSCRDMLADRQTDTQTFDHNTPHPLQGEVKNSNIIPYTAANV